jgi:hypothetical protein
MRHRLALAALCLFPSLALADTPMTPDEFDAYVTDKTISYEYGDGTIGIEHYLPGRKVRWKPDPDSCTLGHWYGAGDEICFVYENDGTPQCWLFYNEPSGLRGRFVSGGDIVGWDIFESAQSDVPLFCAGPEVGV